MAMVLVHCAKEAAPLRQRPDAAAAAAGGDGGGGPVEVIELGPDGPVEEEEDQDRGLEDRLHRTGGAGGPGRRGRVAAAGGGLRPGHRSRHASHARARGGAEEQFATSVCSRLPDSACRFHSLSLSTFLLSL